MYKSIYNNVKIIIMHIYIYVKIFEFLLDQPLDKSV